MCAIGGIYIRQNKHIDLKHYLGSMLSIQRHRGPDAERLWIKPDNSIGLCHNRLAILGIGVSGNQPMHSAGKQITITFNGEIYNYQELRQELASKGSVFTTGTDTEVLIEAYRHWGFDMIHRLRGMFAFAIYDHNAEVLFCTRDRVGKKPFVFAETDSGFIFASEIPAVRQAPGVDTRHDHDAIAAMLLHNLRHIPDPHTAYKGIRRLRPGHAILVKHGKIERAWRYWTPKASDEDTTRERLRSLLEESISLRMRSDVPVGALLSGGIDSSAIVNLMQKQSANPIHTYSLGLNKDDEDLHRARRVANELGTKHKEFYFDKEKQWEHLNKLIGIYGDPIMLLPFVHTYTLCSAIRKDGIKVVLGGNGADELFYGYKGHVRTLSVSRWLDKLSRISPILSLLKRTRLSWVAASRGARKSAFYEFVAKQTLPAFLSQDAISTIKNRAAEELQYWGELCPSNHYIDESNFVGLLVENPHSVTIAGDLPAMAASVEIRSPFLDQEIVSFALATDAEKKIPDTKNPDWLKAILREAVTDLMPESILRAPKRGFGAGIQESSLLSGPWKNKADQILRNASTLNGFLSKEKIEKAWTDFSNGRGNAAAIAKQLAIQLWLKAEHDETN